MFKIYVPNGCVGLEYMYIWYVEVVGEEKLVSHRKRRVIPCKFIELIYSGPKTNSKLESAQIGKTYSLTKEQLADTFEEVIQLVQVQLLRFKQEHFDGITRCVGYTKLLAEEMNKYQDAIAYNQNHILQLDQILQVLGK